ncbi:zinc finger matrin-type protein CG9776-like isoform X2 [Athalia rosae]|uniref:zinc finger matrin-type protein CG9776-like isoform X2 n=1 Tax=Athalia rosae TaxID=37344 RepID=UPI00203351E0|nr:zinc finger matrin-type protein CG9776-like isoform X2 [Athalia rosae]
MDSESRRKGPRSPSPESDESHRRRSRKYERSPSPRRSRYRRSRSRDRRSCSSSRDRRRKETSRNQDWKQPAPQAAPQGPPPAAPGNYQTSVHNQYQAPPPPNTGQPPPTMPPYNPGYNYNYNYNQNYDYSYQQPASYRSDYPPPGWQGTQVPYNSQQPPPPPNLATQSDSTRSVETGPPGLSSVIPRPEDAKKEAIAAEVKQQKATLGKQREEYIKKSTTLQRELEILRQQCDEISKDGDRDNNRILKENQKLQIEIQNKMKSIHNVIDMLTGIIGDKATVDDLKIKFKVEATSKHSRSPKDDFPKGKSESPDRASISDSDKESKVDRDRERDKKTPEDMKPMYNFVHYDPEMHWCKVCDIFPKTAKEYLNHLHSNEHKETCLERKIVDMPWHKANGEGTEKEVPYYPGLPTKRTPIKGLQFFISSTAWYCKLCDSWIGDLHCASLHLKSKRHSENFSRFVEQNPHWETDWMADREKAFSEEKHKQMQIEILKQKEDEPVTKSKKSKKNKKKSKKSKKRRNKSSGTDTTTDSDDSFSDSDQDKSKSIRVAMRNKMKAATQAILNEEIDYHGIKLKGSWAQVAQQIKQGTPEVQQEADDRQLLNSIRDKLKAKQEEEIKSIGRDGIRHQSQEKLSYEEIHSQNPPFPKKEEEDLEAWGPKEPPKSFWIKKEEEKPQSAPSKTVDVPKPEEMPKPHMGFWTKQQVNMAVKPQENKVPEIKEEDRDRERDRDRYKDDRDRKYDRREDKYERYDRYDRNERSDRRRGRDREYYDDRRKRDGSPRRDRNWRDSPKRNYDRYEKDRREDNSSNDESKFEKKTNEFASKFKKVGPQPKKPALPVAKGKLPFIGRLPLFKKKTEEPKMPEKDIAPLPYQQSKFEDTPRVPSDIIKPPGVVHITKLATPTNINNGNSSQLNKLQQMKILVAPPPPMLHESKALTPQVVDMEIEDQSEGVIIEQPIMEDQKEITNLPTLPPPTSQPPPPINRPPFISSPHVTSRPPFTSTRPAFLSTRPPFVTHPPITKPPVQNLTPFIPMQPPPIQSSTSFVQSHTNPPPPLPSVESVTHDILDIPEPAEKRADPSIPLPDDLQEALNIIFPKEEKAVKQHQPPDSVMYATMYSMLGCIGYGPEYMDHPPPEITQADPEPDSQPGPDDLKMLGIDEGDTIF